MEETPQEIPQRFSLCIATPSTGMPRIQYTYSVCHLVMELSSRPVFEGLEEQSVDYKVIEGSGISSAREQLVREVVKDGSFTHLLFIDEDVVFSPLAVYTLISRCLPLVGCNYKLKGPGGRFMAIGTDHETVIPTTTESEGVEECWYTGFGLCLIDVEVLKQFGEDEPMFQLGYIPSTGNYATEDSFFFTECEKKGYSHYVDHDASKQIGHVGAFVYHWSDQWG